MLPGIYISSPGLEASGALGSSSAMVEQGIKVCVCGGGGQTLSLYCILPFCYSKLLWKQILVPFS